MRWDLESRNLDYGNTESQYPSSQKSFEQELDNLKTILSTDQSTKDRARLNRKILFSVLGILAIAGVFVALYFIR